MINSVVLVGRLTRDPDLRKTQTGKSVLAFTLAVNRRGSRQNGQQDADFISCVAWDRTAEVMSQYLHKGSQIGVEGRISTRNYENQQGQRVYVTEVVVNNFSFLDSRNADSQQNYGGYQQNSGYPSNSGYGGGYSQPNPYGGQNGGQGGSYGQNPYGNSQGNSGYGNNPYSTSMNTNLDGAFDDDDSDSFDIDSDDLPF